MAVKKEGWLVKSWRPLSAAVYLFICVFDFVLMPVWYEYVHQKDYTPGQVVDLITRLDGEVAQVEGLKILTEQQRWSPITLGETGLFHVAFGAILGASAWTRGMEKTTRYSSGYYRPSYDTSDDDYEPMSRRPRRRVTEMTPVRGDAIDDPDA